MFAELLANLTAESYAELQVSSPALARAMANDPITRPVIVSFTARDNEAAIEFSNRSNYELSDGSTVSLAVLELMAFSKIGGKSKSNNTSPAGVAKTEAWSILQRIQKGKHLQGEKFALLKDATEERNLSK